MVVQPAIADLFEVAALSHPGSVRAVNEDRAATFGNDEYVGLVVADGVSSYDGAELASQTAVAASVASLAEQPRSLKLAKRLYRAVQRANQAVYDKAIVVPELRGMSTTFTIAILSSQGLLAVHVGDSRLYRLSGTITQLSKDHTLVAEKVRLGLLGKERARHHPDRSTLTHSLGRELIAAVDQFSAPLGAGDRVLLCSDGLHNVLDDALILRLAGHGSALEACQRLVDAANARGAPDNVSAAVACVRAELPNVERPSLFAALRARFTR